MRPGAGKSGADQGERQVLLGAVAVDLAERHGFDQSQIEPLGTGPGDHAVELVVVDALQSDHVDLDVQPGRLGRGNAGHHLLVFAPTRDGLKSGRVERVERDVDPAHAMAKQLFGKVLELASVGGQRELLEPARA